MPSITPGTSETNETKTETKVEGKDPRKSALDKLTNVCQAVEGLLEDPAYIVAEIREIRHAFETLTVTVDSWSGREKLYHLNKGKEEVKKE